MYIGLGIFLLVLGLILATGVITVDLQGIDDGALGVILILGGLLAIGLSLYLSPTGWRRRTTVVRERPATTVRERRVYEDEPPL
ncbi:MAG TPA: DUF6458 family protein [Nocardioidaceae bacterium]|nr:DUF6458 family protein [Nocardioidaceae bacterium]